MHVQYFLFDFYAGRVTRTSNPDFKWKTCFRGFYKYMYVYATDRLAINLALRIYIKCLQLWLWLGIRYTGSEINRSIYGVVRLLFCAWQTFFLLHVVN